MNDQKTFYIRKQTYTQYITTLGISLLLFLVSCADRESHPESTSALPTIEEITHIYSHYIKGDINKFVQHIASCQGKPQSYQKQIVNLYKQQRYKQEQEFGKLDSLHVEQIAHTPDSTYATVHLRTFFSKGTSETILIQMTKTSEGWMIK